MPKYSLNPLEKLIRSTGLTQEKFAEKVGTSPAHISVLKQKNNIKLHVFVAWCELFDFEPKEFL